MTAASPSAPAASPLTNAAPDLLALDVRGVARRFGPNWVLRGCSLALAPGEAAALLGSNGAGKTTLLCIVATLLRPSRGEVRVFGHAPEGEADRVRAAVGMLGTSPALYEDLTAVENLAFALRMRGRTPDAGEIGRALDAAGLDPRRRGGRVREFSSGMRRRVALARLLLHPPRLLLLDEPYASFDADGIDRVNALVLRVKAAGGAALVATHDLPRALPVVERVLRLEDGIVAAEPIDAADGEPISVARSSAGAA